MNDSDSTNPWDDPPEATPAGPPMPDIPPPATEPSAASDIPVYGAPATGSATRPVGTALRPPPVPPESTPVGPPVLSGTYGATPQPEAPAPPGSASSRLIWAAAIIGALVLLGGGAFFALTAFQEDGGAESPEAAVEQLIEAVNNEDFLTLGELLEPGERRTLVEPTLTGILPELIRLGVISDDFDAGDVAGIDLELVDVTYRIDPLAGHEDLVHVHFTGGTASSSANVDDFPFGDEIRRRFGDTMQDAPPTSEPIEEAGSPLVIVQRNGRWYVSMWFSIGETIRLELEERLPSIAEQPAALGSDSPELAVEHLIDEISEFDLEGLIGRLDPEETAALYRYAPLFLDEAQNAAQDARRDLLDEGVSWRVDDLDFGVEGDGDDAIVRLHTFSFSLDTPELAIDIDYGRDRLFATGAGTIDGEAFEGRIDVTPSRWMVRGSIGEETLEAEVAIDSDARSVTLSGEANGERFNGSLTIDESGECSEYTFIGFDESEIGCLEELLDEAGAAGQARQQVLDWFAVTDSSFPSIDFAVHKTSDEWYVSPTLTLMHGVVSGLRSVDEQDFARFLDDLEAASEGEPIELGDLLEGPFGLAGDIGGFSVDPGVFDDVIEVDPVDPGTVPVDDLDPIDDDGGFARGPEMEFIVEPGPDPTPYRDVLRENRERHVYLVGMQEGERLGVTLYGEDVVELGIFDPLLTVERPDGTFLERNDDLDGLNSGLQVTADETGTWRIVVEDLNGGTGGYELTLQLTAPGVDPDIGIFDGGFPGDFDLAEVEDTIDVSVTSGEPFVAEDSISAQTFDVYTLEAAAGTTLQITVQADEGSVLDPRVVVLDVFGQVIAENDDAPFEAGIGSLDSQVTLDIPETDLYFVEVRSFGDFGEGAYTLVIQLL